LNCQNCQEEATVHLTEIVDAEKHERHLCENCAKEQGISIKHSFHITHPNFSAAVPGTGLDLMTEAISGSSGPQCPRCSITFHEFRTQGRLGCPHDYEVFERLLEPLLEKIHGATTHLGKVPARKRAKMDQAHRIQGLRNRLKELVERERYEEAAHIRDEIKSLQVPN
jgi:protein arginine kinase activator